MAKLDVLNLKGEKVNDVKLNDAVFKVESNEVVVAKALKLQLASLRQGTHKTKNRSEVSGGGRKPWRQKGTGRARQGSIRATQWVGGGVAGGVTPRDYTFKINKKERVLALKSALTHKLNNKELVIVDSIKLETLKTKELKDMLSAMNLTGKVLFVTKEDNENLFMASRNLGYAYAIMADEINCYDLVNADIVVCDQDAVEVIEGGLK